MSTPLLPQTELRLATYQKYSEFQKMATIEAIKNYSDSIEKHKETYKKCSSYVKEIGGMLAQWKTSDHLDLALIEMCSKAKDVFSIDADAVDISKLDGTSVTIMGKLFEACAIRDKAPLPELKWDDKLQQIVEKK